ncbi:MAG: hypothetical protein ACKVUS_15800 [Saprospiraceae bacterium]
MEQLPIPKVRFIPECHADTALVRFLVSDFPHIDHESGICNVAKNFQEVKDQTYTLVGIVDDDKRKPPYLDDFQLLQASEGVAVKKKPNKEHYVIVVSPALEKFLLQNCMAVGKRMEDFNLPSDLRQLKKRTKKPQVERNPDFKNLLIELHKQRAPGIIALETFLSDFL